MSKILFVVNTTQTHNYLLYCIEFIANQQKNTDFSIFIDNLQTENYYFSKIELYINSKFSNFKKNSLNKIDITNFKFQNKNISITNKIENIEINDWIIFEDYKKIQLKKFQKLTKNGYLAFDFSKQKVVNQVLNASFLSLNLLHNDTISDHWKIISHQKIKKEQGFYNNLNKLLFNYSIYLNKYLVADKKTNESILVDKIKPNGFKSFFYNFNLIKTIFIRKLSRKKLNWKIGFYKNNELKLLNQPRKSFWADPFIIEKEGLLYLFFEELINNIGKISCVILNKKLEIKEHKIILDKNYHLSFPNVFLFEDSYFMIPESSQDNNLQLYKCISFPFEWKFEMNLIQNIKLIDSVWIFYNNLYWIFANKIEDFEHDNNERLYIYYSEKLLSNNWVSHCQNPVITDFKTARNAGNIFIENNKIFRPSQNCTNGYGNNIVINEITELSILNYSEKKFDEVFASKNYEGTHTYNKTNNYQVADFLVKE